MTAYTYTTPLGDAESTLPDGALGPEIQTDHDRPPLGSFVFGPAYDGTCFIGRSNRLYYCKPKQPSYWPLLFYVEVGAPQFPLKTGVFHQGQPYAFTTRDIFYIQGTGDGTFLPIPMKARTGAQSLQGAAPVDGKGIFHTGPDGIYLFSNGSDRKITEETLEPIFRREDKNGMPAVSTMATSWLTAYKSHLYFGYQDADHDYPTNVLVMSLETSKVSYYTYNDGSDVEIRTIAVDDTNSRLLVGDNTGFVRVIESPLDTEDGDEPIDWQIQVRISTSVFESTSRAGSSTTWTLQTLPASLANCSWTTRFFIRTRLLAIETPNAAW